jgi:AcrR family transcriptional regulator
VVATPTAPDPADLTARARIRDAALAQFAEHGFARTTIRGIARAAGVSPGLVRHHFGSKDDLRRACDDHVVRVSRQYSERAGAAGDAVSGPARSALHPLQRYVARSLVDGSAEAGPLFDQMVDVAEQWIAGRDADRADPPEVDARTRAAIVTAMTVGIPLMREHLSRVLGVDLFAPEGDRLVALGLLDLYSHPLVDPAAHPTKEMSRD